MEFFSFLGVRSNGHPRSVFHSSTTQHPHPRVFIAGPRYTVTKYRFSLSFFFLHRGRFGLRHPRGLLGPPSGDPTQITHEPRPVATRHKRGGPPFLGDVLAAGTTLPGGVALTLLPPHVAAAFPPLGLVFARLVHLSTKGFCEIYHLSSFTIFGYFFFASEK